MGKNRSWMNHRGMNDRRKPEYTAGVHGFLEFAFSGKEDSIGLRCPCVNCNLCLYQDRDMMWEHLMAYGILADYNPWVHHGESNDESDDSTDMYEEDAFVIDWDSSSDDDMSPLVSEATNVRNSSIPQGNEHNMIVCSNIGRVTSPVDSHALDNTQASEQNFKNPTSENHGTGSSEAASGVTLTYRQRRRLQSAEKTGPKRGPRNALRAVRQRSKNPANKPNAIITESMARIIGPNAGQFIAECSHWVKQYCPLNSKNWARMDATAKQKLFDKIKEEWNLPTGPHVDRALKTQCSQLFRFWRYRLKELHFFGKTQNEALNNRPPGVDQASWRWLVVDYWGNDKIKAISENNRKNRKLQKIKAFNGALSTARILDKLKSAPSVTNSNEEPSENGQESNQVPVPVPEPEPEPVYIRLWEETRRHKDGTWDPVAEAKYKEFKKLHAEQIKEHGVDNLTVEEAYIHVLKESSGFTRGLAAGPRHQKNSRTEADSSGLSPELQSQLTQQINNLRQESMYREAALNEKIERMQAEALQREQKSQEEIERMKAEAMQREQEARERENNLQQEVTNMKEQLAYLLKSYESSQVMP